METIILTDNKRLSTDYCADKTLFAEKIDINHILNTEVYQSHISRVRFWIIRSNVHNEESLVFQLCKNLANRGSSQINFQFGVVKIVTGQQQPMSQEKRPNEKYVRSSRVSGYLNPTAMKSLQFPAFMQLKKQPSHTKTTSHSQWTHQQQQYLSNNEQARKNQENTGNQEHKKQDEVQLKQVLKKQFEIGSLNELSAIFANRESIFSEFGISEESLMKSRNVITSYVFSQNELEIGLSVIGEGSRKYLQKSINIEISEAFNIQFNNRKQAYETTCITENFSTSTIPKSSTKLHQMQKQTYHKILLFLFTHYDLESQKNKSMSSNNIGSNGSMSKYIQAIQEWKLKDQDINLTEKLSKEYVLIKQEVQNEKQMFKNKLKVFEAIIGQSVNVDKLLNEEKQMETANNVNLNPPVVPVSGSLAQNRMSRRSEIKNIMNSPQTSSNSNNSEFKRLKQSFEMIRNIDNVVNEQTKKIETLKKIVKQLNKQKNQTLYKHARSLNQVKKEIKQIKDQIEEKKMEFKFKTQKQQNEQNEKKRNFVPTGQAQQVLNGKVQLFKRIIMNERTNKNNEKYLIEDEADFDNNTRKTNKQNTVKISARNTDKVKQSHKTIQALQNNFGVYQKPDQKKQFMIRKQHKSFYTSTDPASMYNTSMTSLTQFPENINRSILNTISQNEKKKQLELKQKRQQQVQHHNLWMSLHQQKNRRTQSQQDANDCAREKEILTMLYQYFEQNNSLLNQVGSEISKYHFVSQSSLQKTMISDNSRMIFKQNKSQLNRLPLNRSTLSSSQLKRSQPESQLNTFNSSLMNSKVNQKLLNCTIMPQLIFDDFPILKDMEYPKVMESAFQSEQCSVATDSVCQIQDKVDEKLIDISNATKTPQKRVTIESMIVKK